MSHVDHGWRHAPKADGGTDPIPGLDAGGGGGYDTVQDEDTPLTQRDTLNFVGGGVSASDVGGVTEVNIPGGGELNRRFVHVGRSPLLITGTPTVVDFWTDDHPDSEATSRTNDAPLDAGYNTTIGTEHLEEDAWDGDYFRITGDPNNAFDIRNADGLYMINVGVLNNTDNGGANYKLIAYLEVDTPQGVLIDGPWRSAILDDNNCPSAGFEWMVFIHENLITPWLPVRVTLSQDSGSTYPDITLSPGGFYCRMSCVRLSPP